MNCEHCGREFGAIIKVQDGAHVVCPSCGRTSSILPRVLLSNRTKFMFGSLFPVLVFVGYNLLLLGSVNGKGEALGFAGMGLMFASFILVPGLLVANCWMLFFRWEEKSWLFLGGLLLPFVVGFLEYLFLYGSRQTSEILFR